MLLSSEKKTADMRGAYGDALVELGKTDSRIVCVGGDTTDSLKTKKFGDKYPERMFNVGIAEANLVSIAAGLAIAGKVAFASTYAAFIPGRAVDQIRNAICYPALNVKLVVSHGGLTVGPDGASHQQIEDLSATRAMPNMRVTVPADAVAVRHLIKAMVDTPGPFYMRLARPTTELVYAESTPADQFRVGRGNVLVDGSDATIIACGLMVGKALEAASALKREEGISARVVDMFTIKPIDFDLVAKCAKETGAIATAEEHNIIGGLGGAVSEAAGETYPVPIKRVGVRDTFGESARDEEVDTLLDKYGLTATEIAKAVIEARSRIRK
ncbi:transketolase, alpha subunit [Candidatus Nitrososphaera evergladensis SR1]|uniref:Transketolase, alpha subunit n=1 Tax=Candidatus Nitrososphaera evergladensis SR1 TaxID=1459636 RepID=A0A075MPG2_9ARCH|nr:transketolase C-terminal domain-containing protein [Candidatus Nitrososphaera evergladensis]AIF82682.1 transketolase, alpha subunit [Candidatus Nitrososphaera evergladensis SR1]